MHPLLSRAAQEALRTSAIELDPHTSKATIRELLAFGIILPLAPGSAGRARYAVTTLGGRWLLHVLIQDDEAVPCRCSKPRSLHDVRSPHASFEGDCRSFTPARPVHESAVPSGGAQEVPRRCRHSPGRG